MRPSAVTTPRELVNVPTLGRNYLVNVFFKKIAKAVYEIDARRRRRASVQSRERRGPARRAVASSMTALYSIQEAQAAAANDLHLIVTVVVTACDEEDVVVADLRDGTSGATEGGRDVDVAEPLEGFVLPVVSARDTGLGDHVDAEAVEHVEPLGVLDVAHGRGQVRACEDVGDRSCGSVGLAVVDDVDVDRGCGAGCGAGDVGGNPADVDGLDHSEAPVAGRLRVALRDERELSGGRDLASGVGIERECRVKELEFALRALEAVEVAASAHDAGHGTGNVGAVAALSLGLGNVALAYDLEGGSTTDGNDFGGGAPRSVAFHSLQEELQQIDRMKIRRSKRVMLIFG